MQEEQQTTVDADQNYFQTLKIAVEAFFSNQWKLIKMEVAEKSAKGVSILLLVGGSVCLLFFVVFALSMVIGYAFALLTGSTATGFAALSALYFILMLIAWMGRKLWIRKIANATIKIFFNKHNDEGGQGNAK